MSHTASAGNSGELSQQQTETSTAVQHLGCRFPFSVTCPGFHHLLLTSSVILLLYCSRIPPSVVNQLCDPPPLLLALCLQSLSARIVLKRSRELLELFLQPGLFLIFLLSDLTFPLMIRGRNGLNFLLFLHFVSALHRKHLLFSSSGFGVLFQALLGFLKTYFTKMRKEKQKSCGHVCASSANLLLLSLLRNPLRLNHLLLLLDIVFALMNM